MTGIPFRHNNKQQGNRKLTQEKVRDIRTLYEGGMTQGALAREFDVSVIQIGRIVRYEVWRDAPAAVPTRAAMQSTQERLAELQGQLERREIPSAEKPSMDSLLTAEPQRDKDLVKEFYAAPLRKEPPPMALDEDFNPPDETEGSGLKKLQQTAKEILGGKG